MKWGSYFITGAMVSLLCSAAPAGPTAGPGKEGSMPWSVSHYENVLGTSMELKVSAFSPEAAAVAESAVLHEIGRMTKILSGYEAGSEFSRWFRTSGEAVRVSPELFDVLNLFDQWRIRSDGALDASAEVIGRLWKQSAAEQRMPTDAELAAAVKLVHQPHWSLDAKAHTATHLSQAPLMLNSFVKSYIIRHAADAGLACSGVSGIVVNIGGDLVVAGPLKETVLVSDPRSDAENDTPLDRLSIGNRAVATSGNYRRGERIHGQWYSHIVDPRTGQPADDILSATVVAPSATDAGALATAFNVMKPSESQELAASMPGVDYLIITRNGQRIASRGWASLEIKEALPSMRTKGEKEGLELLINLEINLQKESVTKRPYVAVWIEDENHAPVRTVCLWHGSNRYVPELKSWYMKYRERYTTDKEFGSTVTSATRSAGKYSVKWDGKDDKGNEVKPGKYTVKIEISREHGTYQLMRQEIDWDQTARQWTLPGNIEIAAASMEIIKR
jgi:thiamine biosynthesis lipoprotein